MKEILPDDAFLTAATAGLTHDPELQLDVRAELKSHLDERRRAAEAAGLAPDAATQDAVQAMGPAPDLAVDLEQANRKKMRLRSLVRLAATWLLAPLAVAVALLTLDWNALRVPRLLQGLTGSEVSGHIPSWSPRLTPDQRLVLNGDPTRSTRLAQQKAIWERWPTNRVYMQNYVTYLVSDYDKLGSTTDACYRALSAEIAKLRPLDPDNARFDYILAGKLLDEAVDQTSRDVKGPDGQTKSEYDIIVKDRAKLDEAMARFMAGLAKPEFRRYTRELAVERLAIMGEPQSMLQQIAEVGMLAGLFLPDLSYLRKLSRTSLFYGELLAREGRREEADRYLNAYRILIPQFNRDSFTLIDVLVTGAMAGHAADRVPGIYEKLGDSAAAERARKEAGRLAAPVKQWRERRQAMEKSAKADQYMAKLHQEGGILAGLLLPALGEYPTADELAPSRQLEYVIVEGAALIILSSILVGLMLLCGLASVYYSRFRGGGHYSLLLLPGPGETARLLAWGVLLPLAVFYAVTRGLPWSGRNMSLLYGLPTLTAQALALLFAMLGILGMTSARRVRRRCAELQLPVPPSRQSGWNWVLGGLFTIVAIPALTGGAWFKPEERNFDVLSLGLLGLLLLLLLALLVRWIVREIQYGRTCAAYYGSLARTLLPVFALALILVNVCSRPYLRFEERRLLRIDTLMRPDPNGGFTSIESRVTQRLKAELEKAAEGLGKAGD